MRARQADDARQELSQMVADSEAAVKQVGATSLPLVPHVALACSPPSATPLSLKPAALTLDCVDMGGGYKWILSLLNVTRCTRYAGCRLCAGQGSSPTSTLSYNRTASMLVCDVIVGGKRRRAQAHVADVKEQI
jgi:hypothetical protein